MIYYNVYSRYGNWVGRYSCEYQAEMVAAEYDGYYTEEEEQL